MARKCDAWDALGLKVYDYESYRVQCQLAEVDSTKLEHLSTSTDAAPSHMHMELVRTLARQDCAVDK
jgi:hypothetical protein